MIKRINNLPNNFPRTVAAARIKALFNAYSPTVGIDLFCQTVNSEVTAVFGGMDGSFSLCVFGQTDFLEIKSYFEFLGALCFCDCEVAEKLKSRQTEMFDLYQLDNEPMVSGLPYCNAHEPISSIYDVLRMGVDGDITLPPFEFWYTDFCARFNHNSAEFAVMRNATAVCGFMTEEISLITGVAVAKTDRNKGLGQAVLGTLIHNIWVKYPRSQIFALTVTAGKFYEHLNFKHEGKVALCRF